MPDETDEFFAKLRSAVEKRVRKQLTRHARIDPNVNHNNILNIQIGEKAERLERLERMYEKYDDEGQDKPAEAVRFLVEGWLPDPANPLKR